MTRLSIESYKLTETTTTSGTTVKDIHIFVDEYGNVIQIKKEKKKRRNYYIDPNFPAVTIQGCIIGVEDEFSGPCSYGIGLGIGDDLFAYAIYK
jgi:hypothetical protein